MKYLKYYGSIILSVLNLIAIGAVTFLGFWLMLKGKNTALAFTCIVIDGILFLMIKQIQKLRISTRRDVEYDEYGLSKSRGRYEYLSKKERDAIDLQNLATMENLVSSSVIKKLTKKGSSHPQKDLDELIGLETVKIFVKKLEARLKFEKMKSSKSNVSVGDNSTRHLVFYGNPGTGKTTVARIITGILYENKVISKNQCIEIDGNFLNAGSQSGTKTDLVVRYAKGGVLFIDEAYSMINNPEAIATLIKLMEDKRDEFVVILAGYTGPMTDLIESNPGFRSRVNFVTFDDYNALQLRDIANLMANEQGLVIDLRAMEYFDYLILKERQSSSFGNARTVRTIIDKAVDQHAFNLMEKKIKPEDKFKLLVEDFQYS